MIKKYRKFLKKVGFISFPIISFVSLTSCSISDLTGFEIIERPGFRLKQTKNTIYSVSRLNNLEYKKIDNFKRSFELYENVIKNKYVDQIKTLTNIDSLIYFYDNSIYDEYKVYGLEKLVDQGILVIYLIESKNWDGQEISDFSDKKIYTISIGGFLKRNVSYKLLESENHKIDNSVGIKITNSDQETTIGNARFINYLSPDNEGEYPKKWFLLSAGHLFFDQMDQEEFGLTLFHTNLEDKTVKAKVIQDGRDQWSIKMTPFEYFLPEEYKDTELHSYLDYAIIEVNFDTEEEARKWTSTSQENNIFSESYTNNFNQNAGYYDVQNNQSVFKHIETKNKQLLLDAFKTLIINKISFNFFEDKKFFELNGKKYIDLSSMIMPTGTDFEKSAQGSVEKINSVPNIFIGTSQNNGLWLPAKMTSEFQYFDKYYSRQYPNSGSLLMFNYRYNIFYNADNLNQAKSFDKTIETLYPTKRLGFELCVDLNEYTGGSIRVIDLNKLIEAYKKMNEKTN
ncbi:hypothetical protein [Mycoplasmopsis gallinacea]|uniref:DUF31 domain-containing protein n=1 Tax=Mycoplasmopsis gallinacea TaxID=29556 RepID=A0A6H0V4L8_9BACT|nr:hypothetical protein [Mycoplasmopsis gallinacea]QIW61967.1 hypothetical protein GOQ20_00570 [Mycoplasmopsis gallinacea]